MNQVPQKRPRQCPSGKGSSKWKCTKLGKMPSKFRGGTKRSRNSNVAPRRRRGFESSSGARTVHQTTPRHLPKYTPRTPKPSCKRPVRHASKANNTKKTKDATHHQKQNHWCCECSQHASTSTSAQIRVWVHQYPCPRAYNHTLECTSNRLKQLSSILW